MRVIIVEWVDSAFLQGWMSRDDVKTHRISPCVSVGLLVNETRDQITIMQSAGKEQYGDGLTIPRVCIKRMRTLKVR